MRIFIILILMSFAHASNSCEVILLKNQNIHIACRNPVSNNDIRLYEKKSPNRTVIAIPKYWKLKYDKNAGFEVKHLKNAYYIVVKKIYAPKLERNVRRNHVSFTQSKYNEYCEWAQMNRAPFLIVVDPGHGGHDPGTIVKNHKEKDIALNFSKTLKKSFEGLRLPIKVVLTRSDDRYLTLDQRRNIAQKNHADLFMSIHADGSPNLAARGLSIFTLSNAKLTV